MVPCLPDMTRRLILSLICSSGTDASLSKPAITGMLFPPLALMAYFLALAHYSASIARTNWEDTNEYRSPPRAVTGAGYRVAWDRPGSCCVGGRSGGGEERRGIPQGADRGRRQGARCAVCS